MAYRAEWLQPPDVLEPTNVYVRMQSNLVQAIINIGIKYSPSKVVSFLRLHMYVCI